jgi:GNAT superfamily N-acetyltransferase
MENISTFRNPGIPRLPVPHFGIPSGGKSKRSLSGIKGAESRFARRCDGSPHLGKNMTEPIVYELSENEIDEALELAVLAYGSDQEFHKAFGFRKPLSLSYIRSVHHLKLLSYFAVKPLPLGVRSEDKLAGFALYTDTMPPGKMTPEQTAKYLETRSEYDVLNRGLYSPSMWLYSFFVMRAFPKAPFYMVDTIAISPAYWGQGCAKRLLHEIIDRSLHDPTSTGVGITTYSLTKAEIYQHIGFTMLRHRRILGVDTCSLFLSHPSKRREI